MFTPAAQPIKTKSVPAGRLPRLNAGRYSISTGNVGIARSSWPTLIEIHKGMSFLLPTNDIKQPLASDGSPLLGHERPQLKRNVQHFYR